MKKTMMYLLTGMLVCITLFTGCAEKTLQKNRINDDKVVSGVIDNLTENNGIKYHFVEMYDNGINKRSLMTTQEKLNLKKEQENRKQQGICVLPVPEFKITSAEEYLDYIAKNSLPNGFIRAENFASTESLTLFYKHRYEDTYNFLFRLPDGYGINVSVTYDNDEKNILNNKVSQSIIYSQKLFNGSNLLKYNDESNSIKYMAVGNNVLYKYERGYLTGIEILTDNAHVKVWISGYSDSDYENRGTAQARLKDTALVRFGDILRESESWISNFVDMSKVKLAVAEAGAFVAKDAKAEIK